MPRVVVFCRLRARPGVCGVAPRGCSTVGRASWVGIGSGSVWQCGRPGRHPSDACPVGGVPGSGQDDPFGFPSGL
ncbi:hypothetical protein STVIR_4666 [Streptomyces viridochromogenes Tue57]|uniref:Uncharacterized protein n=1 Tax=Streptomyces viridochromogenes Tue57 TaxID=1160705 RepID=L8PD67_STRVR|nr:hypothetical protein STVIR_4666 [Streptomyces viridochromogenes Tue57]